MDVLDLMSVHIKAGDGVTRITVNGMEMNGVTNYSISQDGRATHPKITIEFLAGKLEYDAP